MFLSPGLFVSLCAALMAATSSAAAGMKAQQSHGHGSAMHNAAATTAGVAASSSGAVQHQSHMSVGFPGGVGGLSALGGLGAAAGVSISDDLSYFCSDTPFYEQGNIFQVFPNFSSVFYGACANCICLDFE